MVHSTMKVLIVEDEALLAMDIGSIIEDSGHLVVGEAASLREVQALPDTLNPTLALVDIQLDDGSNGVEVSQLIHHRWPRTVVVFVTANPQMIVEDHAGAFGLIAKPFSRTGLLSAIRYLEEGIFHLPPTTAEPSSLRVFPSIVQTRERP